jgi:hypothetical protein
MLRAKKMQAHEWLLFQNEFAAFAFATKDPAYTMFRESGSLVEPSTILIAASDTTALEALSPGDWFDCTDARQRTWQLLVGSSNAHEHYGVLREFDGELQSDPRTKLNSGSSSRSRMLRVR